MTHTRFLPHVLQTASVLDQIYGRFIRMCHGMDKSKNRKVKNIFKVCMSSARSIVRRNLRAIERRLDVPFGVMLNFGASLLKRKYITEATDCDKVLLNVIRELREARNCQVLIPGFNLSEICDFIDFTCTL